jgi:nucleoside-diphosphate-sugar epimerase
MEHLEADVTLFGYGIITSEIIKKLIIQGYKVICVTNDKSIHRDPQILRRVRFLTRSEVMQVRLNSTNVIFSWRNLSPVTEDNQQLKSWMASKSFKIQKSFLLSSSSVYPDSLTALMESADQADFKLPTNDKYNLEIFLSQIINDKDGLHTNLRISNVYGPSLKYGFIGSLLESVESGKPAVIFTNKNITRDFITLCDVVYGVIELLNLEINNPIINISTGIGNSISDVLGIFSSFGHQFENRIRIDPPKEFKIHSVLNCSLLSKYVNWTPAKLDQGLTDILSGLN